MSNRWHFWSLFKQIGVVTYFAADDYDHKNKLLPHTAMSLLSNVLYDPTYRSDFCEILTHCCEFSDCDRLSTLALANILQRQIENGFLLVVKLPEDLDLNAIAPQIKDNINVATTSLDSWIEIELINDDGYPVANERYKIITAKGQEISGTLDDNGYAYIKGIVAGTCKVTFPDLPADGWA
ncbi:MAG: hypothetical protein JW841_07320 [Deltaproteobacteria bacterium]|nr:hypothetical protein [Deltaproteobacteria bacterium]